MRKAIINTVFILLLVALAIMTVTGLMFIFKAGNHTAGEIHMITGLSLIGLSIINIILFRKMLCAYMCTRSQSGS